MMFEKKFDAKNITFDFSKPYTIARVPEIYPNAETFALQLVYDLGPYVARKLNIDCHQVVLIAISKNNKVVVLCDNDRYRDWLFRHFQKSSLGIAQFYDDVKPEQIIEKMSALFH